MMKIIERNWLVGTESDDDHLTVLQWNCLADWASDAFPCVDPKLLTWSYRKPLIIAECLRTAPDIICLQEVDHFDELAEALSDDYRGMFKAKGRPGEIARDGSAIFWRADRLSVVAKADYDFAEICGRPEMSQIFMCPTFELTCHDGASSRVRVLNTHLKARSEFEDVRTEQCCGLTRFLNELGEGNERVGLLVVCGDFNTTAESPGVTGLIEETKSFQLQSTYRALRHSQLGVDSEPEWTTWKIREQTKKCTIDFIFSNRESNWHPVDILCMPEDHLIDVNQALPSFDFPSDHCSLVTKFERR